MNKKQIIVLRTGGGLIACIFLIMGHGIWGRLTEFRMSPSAFMSGISTVTGVCIVMALIVSALKTKSDQYKPNETERKSITALLVALLMFFSFGFNYYAASEASAADSSCSNAESSCNEATKTCEDTKTECEDSQSTCRDIQYLIELR